MGYNTGRQGNRNFDRQGPEMAPPVNVGDVLDVKIEAVGEKGDGIARQKGFVLFVPNTQEGQIVKIKVTKVLRKVGFAEVVGEGDASALQQQRPKMVEERNLPPVQEENAPEDTENFGEEEAPQADDAEEPSPKDSETMEDGDSGDEDDEDVPKPDDK